MFSVRCAADRQSVASRPQKHISEVHFHGFVVLCFKMVVSNRVLSMVRVLAIIHILDGVSLIIFGIVDSVSALLDSKHMFTAGHGFHGVWIGAWVSVLCRNSAFV